MLFKSKNKIKSAIVTVVLFSLTLQMIPAPQRAMAFDFGEFLDKIFQKVQIPNEFELTERGGLKLGTETRNYLGMFDCMFKQSLDGSIGFCGCDSSFHCGYTNAYKYTPKASCASEWKPGDVCISPFSTFKLGEWQTDLTEQTEFGRALAVPQPKAPRECQLKIPLPEDDFSMSVEEKSAHQAACNYFIALEQAAAQEVFAVKKMYNNTDPLSDCFFLRNCKSNCSLRFGEVRYDITVLDILKFLIPGGVFTYIQQIMTIVSTIQKIARIASTIKGVLVDGALVLNDIYDIVQNFSSLASAWENMGLKWKDALSVITGPIGWAINQERLKKGYDGFLGLIQNFSNNMVEYSGAKTQALQVADQSVKDLTAIISEGKPDETNPSKGIAGFKNEPEIGFLFATDKAGKNGKDNYDKRVMFDGIIKDYQNAFISIRGLLNNISAIGDVVGTQSITERRNIANDQCFDWFKVFCTCHSNDKCRNLNNDFDFDGYWLKNRNMTFLNFLKKHPAFEQDLNESKVQKCEQCWNQYDSCMNQYCSEGVSPDEVRFVAFDTNNPNSNHTVALICDPTVNSECEYADNITKEARETAKKVAPELNCSSYACIVDQNNRYIPKGVVVSGETKLWFNEMKTSFGEVQRLASLFSVFDVGYVQGKINNALSFVPDYKNEDKGINIPKGVYLFNELNYSKAPWRVFWEDLSMATAGLSATEFYDKTNIKSKFYWGDDGKADMEQRHRNAISYVVSAIPSFVFIAFLDESFAKFNYKFDEGKYDSAVDRALCNPPAPNFQQQCFLTISFNPVVNQFKIEKNGDFSCPFILPQHVQQCLLDIREFLQERTVFSAGLISNWEKSVTTTAASLNITLGALQGDAPVNSKTPLERFWNSANWCTNDVNSCYGGWKSKFETSYKSELAELPDWDGRIEAFFRNALPVDGPTSNIENIAEAITDFNLSPENSILVYYIIKARQYFQDLADTNNANGFEARIDAIMLALKCGQGGTNCDQMCSNFERDCFQGCDNLNNSITYNECKDVCNQPSLASFMPRLRTVIYSACDDVCFDRCDDRGCNQNDCESACEEGQKKCAFECPSMFFDQAGGDNNETCQKLQELKQKIDDFFASKDYQNFDDYLNQAKNILRKIQTAWETPLKAGNPAQIARGYLEKIISLIYWSRMLVEDNRDETCLRLLKDDPAWEAPVPKIIDLIGKVNSIIHDIMELIYDPALQALQASDKEKLQKIADDLQEPATLVQTNILDEINNKVGTDYGKTCDDSPTRTDFLNSVTCFEQKKSKRSLCQVLSFLDVMDILFASQEKITETKQAIEVLKPQIKMEFNQAGITDRKAIEMMKGDPLGKFPFWEKDGNGIKIAGVPIKGFADFKKAVDLNPIAFLQGAYKAISDNLIEIALEHNYYYKIESNGAKKKVAIFPRNPDLATFASFGSIPNVQKETRAGLLLEAKALIADDDVFGGNARVDEDRRIDYGSALDHFRTQNIVDLGRRVFGDNNLTTACKLISPILQSDPRDTLAMCETRAADLITLVPAEQKALEVKCKNLLNVDLSILDRQPDDIQTEIDRLNKQRIKAGVGDIACPDKCPSGANLQNTTCQNGLTCADTGNYLLAASCFTCPLPNLNNNANLDGQHLGNGDWCWPPKMSPLDRNGYTQGYQAVSEFCKTTEGQLGYLGGAGLSNICSIVDLPTDEATCNNETDANLEVIQKAVDAQLEQCNEMEAQKAFEKECQYIDMLIKHVFNGSCNLSSCSSEENEDFANGADPTRCKERCKEARDTIKPALCFQLTGKTNCSIPDLSLKGISIDLDPDCTQIDVKGEGELNDDEKGFCLLLEARDKALNACSFGADNIKQPLDEVMKIFSILIGIRSATKLYNGVQSFVGDVKKMSDSFSKLIKAIKGDGGEGEKKTKGILTQLQDAWEGMNEESGAGGLTITPLQCNSHPAESYSDLTKQKVSGPQGGPVCPDVSDFFGQAETQFGLIRNNVKQIDLSRKDIEQRYLPLPFKLNIHLFDKKEVVFPSINELHDTASAIKQKAQFVWALAFAVNFAAKNCTCGESYCKMPFCISGLPLAFGPISNASCYLTWVLRYPMLKIAESLESDLEQIE